MKENLFQRMVRKAISKAANLTPSVVYYADGWPATVNDNLVKLKSGGDEEQSPLSTAAIAIACAMHSNMKKGDVATIQLTGVTRKDEEIGDFVVTARRL